MRDVAMEMKLKPTTIGLGTAVVSLTHRPPCEDRQKEIETQGCGATHNPENRFDIIEEGSKKRKTRGRAAEKDGRK